MCFLSALRYCTLKLWEDHCIGLDLVYEAYSRRDADLCELHKDTVCAALRTLLEEEVVVEIPGKSCGD